MSESIFIHLTILHKIQSQSQNRSHVHSCCFCMPFSLLASVSLTYELLIEGKEVHHPPFLTRNTPISAYWLLLLASTCDVFSRVRVLNNLDHCVHAKKGGPMCIRVT